jgi:hypothetical protein
VRAYTRCKANSSHCRQSKSNSAASNYSVGRSYLLAECIGGTNEKGIFDHSNPAAIGGLGGCTEHIDTQFAVVNQYAKHTINISIVDNTRHNEFPINSFLNVAVLNFAKPAIDNSGHDLNHDHDDADHSDIQQQFIVYD